MSGDGAPDQEVFDASALKVAVVAASWHTQVMDGLLAGAERALTAYGVHGARTVRVPGTFELPVVASALAAQGYDAIVALGVVIRGGTPHFDYVCNAATDGLVRVAPRPHGRGRLRRPHLRQRPAGARTRRAAALPGGQGLRGHVGRAAHRPDPGGGRRPHAVGLLTVKTFDELWAELSEKARTRPEGSGTVRELDAGVHAIGKKLVEEAAESWMAAEHEGPERTAEEISQLLYHAQVLMLASGIELDDVYAHL